MFGVWTWWRRVAAAGSQASEIHREATNNSSGVSTVVVGVTVVVVGVTVVVVGVTVVVVGVVCLVVAGDAFVVAGASVAAVSVIAVSVAPPEQAETNMLSTRNPATARFMPGVFHASRSATQRERVPSSTPVSRKYWKTMGGRL
jgi:hypothetical protein